MKVSAFGMTALVILGQAYGCSGPSVENRNVQLTATEDSYHVRGAIEICDNAIDDDGDGAVDEAACQISPTGSPTSNGAIVPETWSDNPNCEALGYRFGFKVNNAPNGTFCFTTEDGELTGGTLADPNNCVTITNAGSGATSLDWSSTLPIDAVFVKGGPVGGNLYVYSPEWTSDTGLATPGGVSGISHVEFCYDYELTVSKTAETSFTRTYEWAINKGADGEYWKFIGAGPTTHGYSVSVDRTETDSDWAVAGQITIANNTPFAATVESVGDVLSEGATVVTSCPGGLPRVLTAGDTMVCSYETALGAPSDGTNTVKVTTSGAGPVGGATATADFSFSSAAITEVGDASVHVTDTNGQSWMASGDSSWSYARDFSCPSDPTRYVNGYYLLSHENTATISETGQSDSATVTVHCYAPIVGKTAGTSYTRTYTWTISKAASPTSHVGLAGDSFSSTYGVGVDQTVTDSAFAVAGTITVANPNPTEAMEVSLADSVGGVTVALSCGGSLTVAAGGTASCDYSASLPAKTDGTNTAIVSLNGLAFGATATYAFGDPTSVVGYGSVTVTDTQPESPAPWGASGDAIWGYTGNFACPTAQGYYTNGVFRTTVPNIATIVETGQSANASVELTCYLPARARVVKATTEGSEEIGQLPFTFTLYDPSGAAVETQTLNGSGEVAFSTELRAIGTWNVVETAKGWAVQPSVTCSVVVAYPSAAGKTFTCSFDNTEMSRLTVTKLTQGAVNPSQDWTFAIYEGAFGGAMLASASTFGDADGLLDFGKVDLDPAQKYTLCEMGVPAGWATLWQIGVKTVVPYNPNASDDPPQDIGNRCVDVGASTSLPLIPGETLAFQVNNTQPGGEPRTPGYWKNWNRCTGGGQAANADRNGGWQEGFWLVEDVLDPSIGGGIVWDDNLADDFVFTIDACAVAVDILDQRDVANPAVVGDGRKAAKDGAYTLAMHLLAAQLNFAAGAQSCDAAQEAALQGELMLDSVDFDGTGTYWTKGSDRRKALELAATLDSYNNGALCTRTAGE